MKQTVNNHTADNFLSKLVCVTENSSSLPKILLSWPFSRIKTDLNSKEDGSLQQRLCFQDVAQALYLVSYRDNNLFCACFGSFVGKYLSFLPASFLWLETCYHIISKWKRVAEFEVKLYLFIFNSALEIE